VLRVRDCESSYVSPSLSTHSLLFCDSFHCCDATGYQPTDPSVYQWDIDDVHAEGLKIEDLTTSVDESIHFLHQFRKSHGRGWSSTQSFSSASWPSSANNNNNNNSNPYDYYQTLMHAALEHEDYPPDQQGNDNEERLVPRICNVTEEEDEATEAQAHATETKKASITLLVLTVAPNTSNDDRVIGPTINTTNSNPKKNKKKQPPGDSSSPSPPPAQQDTTLKRSNRCKSRSAVPVVSYYENPDSANSSPDLPTPLLSDASHSLSPPLAKKSKRGPRTCQRCRQMGGRYGTKCRGAKGHFGQGRCEYFMANGRPIKA
jgi:hypothetical protein